MTLFSSTCVKCIDSSNFLLDVSKSCHVVDTHKYDNRPSVYVETQFASRRGIHDFSGSSSSIQFPRHCSSWLLKILGWELISRKTTIFTKSFVVLSTSKKSVAATHPQAGFWRHVRSSITVIVHSRISSRSSSSQNSKWMQSWRSWQKLTRPSYQFLSLSSIRLNDIDIWPTSPTIHPFCHDQRSHRRYWFLIHTFPPGTREHTNDLSALHNYETRSCILYVSSTRVRRSDLPFFGRKTWHPRNHELFIILRFISYWIIVYSSGSSFTYVICPVWLLWLYGRGNDYGVREWHRIKSRFLTIPWTCYSQDFLHAQQCNRDIVTYWSPLSFELSS